MGVEQGESEEETKSSVCNHFSNPLFLSGFSSLVGHVCFLFQCCPQISFVRFRDLDPAITAKLGRDLLGKRSLRLSDEERTRFLL